MPSKWATCALDSVSLPPCNHEPPLGLSSHGCIIVSSSIACGQACIEVSSFQRYSQIQLALLCSRLELISFSCIGLVLQGQKAAHSVQ